jgi:acetylornithine deacetylase/succinyl-diaminopimelate desuccinylase-like protein
LVSLLTGCEHGRRGLWSTCLQGESRELKPKPASNPGVIYNRRMTQPRPRFLAGLLGLAALSAATVSVAQQPGEAAFRATYKELIETNTTLSAGSCTLAVERMAARLEAAGIKESDLHFIIPEDKPKEGGLVAVFPGTDPTAKAILLLAHVDVVEAKREDWTRDPFTLIEEDGYFYARGTLDDKAQAAIWVDLFVRLKAEGYQPQRTLKLALTCGEETSGAYNGAEDLATNHRQLIDAEFAINEGAGGRLDEAGRPQVHTIQAGEKLPQNYSLEVTNPGGHSSRPVKENAINRLAAALVKVGDYEFPIVTNETTVGFFKALGPILGGEVGAALSAFASDPSNTALAQQIAAADPSMNAILHTTCIATMLDAGHATNALPQRATANVNCRIFPGTSVESVRQSLEAAVADPQVKVTTLETRSAASDPPPLTPAILGPARQVSEELFPGVPFVPMLQAGGTDGAFLTPAGIPTYGISGIFIDADLNGIHGLNERLRVKSLLDGREYLYRLVKIFAAQGG